MSVVDHDVSVVIATLGGEQLPNTISALNSGSLIPHEILICIPKSFAGAVVGIHNLNVRVVTTSCMGQVAQRAEGFKQARNDIVLQLDDDIDLSSNTLMQMVASLTRLGRHNVVGPVFLDKLTGNPLSPFPTGLKGYLISFYYWMFGALPFGKSRMGCLSSICVSSSIDPTFFSGESVKTQWLAGGCVLGYRDDLIVKNFFPFEGKAYAEDGLHSFLRIKQGISHHVVLNARVSIDVPTNRFVWNDFVREMGVRIEIVRIMQGSVVRKSLYILAESLRRVVWRINHR